MQMFALMQPEHLLKADRKTLYTGRAAQPAAS
jgi:hypothetical protein